VPNKIYLASGTEIGKNLFDRFFRNFDWHTGNRAVVLDVAVVARVVADVRAFHYYRKRSTAGIGTLFPNPLFGGQIDRRKAVPGREM